MKAYLVYFSLINHFQNIRCFKVFEIVVLYFWYAFGITVYVFETPFNLENVELLVIFTLPKILTESKPKTKSKSLQLRNYQKELTQLAEKGKNVIISAPPGKIS